VARSCEVQRGRGFWKAVGSGQQATCRAGSAAAVVPRQLQLVHTGSQACWRDAPCCAPHSTCCALGLALQAPARRLQGGGQQWAVVVRAAAVGGGGAGGAARPHLPTSSRSSVGCYLPLCSLHISGVPNAAAGGAKHLAADACISACLQRWTLLVRRLVGAGQPGSCMCALSAHRHACLPASLVATVV
jgi:hypothetical protein